MNLQPVDFKAVAAKGAYVYCYLREHDRTPYYVGISENKNGRRPYELHSCWHPLTTFSADLVAQLCVTPLVG